MALTPELAKLRAELEARLALEEKPRPPKPKLVVDHGPHWRPPGWAEVSVNPAYERAWHQREYDKAVDRAQRRAIDPFDYGHWGPTYDE
jgi:hypothetical protein